MNANGDGQTRRTLSPAHDGFPEWSPGGDRIAFASNRTGSFEIYTMAPDGNGLTQLTSHVGGDTEPAWSPDGTKIAFTSDRDGNDEIYVMNVDGSAATNMTMNVAIDAGPDWQPVLPLIFCGKRVVVNALKSATPDFPVVADLIDVTISIVERVSTAVAGLVGPISASQIGLLTSTQPAVVDVASVLCP